MKGRKTTREWAKGQTKDRSGIEKRQARRGREGRHEGRLGEEEGQTDTDTVKTGR